MNDIEKEIEALLKEDNVELAEKKLEAIFMSKLTPEEKAALHIDIATLYMRVMISVGERYRGFLEKSLRELESLSSAEKKTYDRVNLAKVRSSLR